MREIFCYGILPPIDHAIEYVTVPDDGRCKNIPRDILCEHMEYRESCPLFIIGVEAESVAVFLQVVQERCRCLGEVVKQKEDAYGIDQLQFYPKEIFLLATDTKSDAAAAWLSSMAEDDYLRPSLTCRINTENHYTIVPVIFY